MHTCMRAWSIGQHHARSCTSRIAWGPHHTRVAPAIICAHASTLACTLTSLRADIGHGGLDSLYLILASIYMILVVIIFLNLVIALINDSYDRVHMNQTAESMRNKVGRGATNKAQVHAANPPTQCM